MEHGEPIRPLGRGGPRLPNSRCDASLFKRPVWGIHSCWAELTVNCLLKACAIAFGLEWVFPSKAIIEIFGWGFDFLPPSLRSKDQKRLGLVARSEDSIRHLYWSEDSSGAGPPLDILPQQLDGRVERVISAPLISLRDEGSHNFGKRAAIIPDITTGNVDITHPIGCADDLTCPDCHASNRTVAHLFSCPTHPMDLAPGDR